MKILILSYYFGPENTIAAIRWTKIAKYFKRMSNEVTVICGPYSLVDEILLNDINEIKEIIRIKPTINFNLSSKFLNRYTKKTGFKYFLFKTLKYLLKEWGWLVKDIINSFLWYMKAKKDIRVNENFDFIIASYGPVGTILLGIFLKKKNRSTKLLIDIRDPIQPGSLKNIFLRMFQFYIEKKSIAYADGMVFVSNGLMERYNSVDKPKILISNGYDEEDLNNLKKDTDFEININKEKGGIIFVYSGSLYEGKSDISPLIDFISNDQNKERFKFIYLGKDTEVFNRWIKNKKNDVFFAPGFIPRKDALKFLMMADILVMATWNYPDEKGIITGKMYEYLMFNKPILCFVKGSRNSEVEAIINELKAGICFYNDYDSIGKLETFLQNMNSCFAVHKKKEKYSYKKISEKYLKFMEEIKDESTCQAADG